MRFKSKIKGLGKDKAGRGIFMANQVLIIMGSDSDWPVMKEAVLILKEFVVGYEVHVASAHRTTERALALAREAQARDFAVIIAGAGAAAHLPGVLAAVTPLPVIGVPLTGTALQGVDALYAMVQMPTGVPVATVAIDGAKNAALLAIRILGIKETALQEELVNYQKQSQEKVWRQHQKIQKLVQKI